MALDQQNIANAEFQDVYDQAGGTFTLLGDSDRARYIRGFIKYLVAYDQAQSFDLEAFRP